MQVRWQRSYVSSRLQNPAENREHFRDYQLSGFEISCNLFMCGFANARENLEMDEDIKQEQRTSLVQTFKRQRGKQSLAIETTTIQAQYKLAKTILISIIVFCCCSGFMLFTCTRFWFGLWNFDQRREKMENYNDWLMRKHIGEGNERCVIFRGQKERILKQWHRGKKERRDSVGRCHAQSCIIPVSIHLSRIVARLSRTCFCLEVLALFCH